MPETSEIEDVMVQVALRAFAFEDDVGGSFPVSVDVYDITLKDDVVGFTVSFDLGSVPDHHQTFAEQWVKEELLLDLKIAMGKQLEKAGLSGYKLRSGEIDVQF